MVIAEVGSLLLPVPKIGLLAKGYRFLRGAKAVKTSVTGFKSLGAAGRGFSKTLQTGGHTLNKSTLRALKLSKQQGKRAIEGLKKDLRLPSNFHGKIMGNGDLVHPHSRQVIGNLFDYLH